MTQNNDTGFTVKRWHSVQLKCSAECYNLARIITVVSLSRYKTFFYKCFK
jgi:hypothetical protein